MAAARSLRVNSASMAASVSSFAASPLMTIIRSPFLASLIPALTAQDFSYAFIHFRRHRHKCLFNARQFIGFGGNGH
jgi:hypothetical protein